MNVELLLGFFVMRINVDKAHCFRITHIDNLGLLLDNGITCKTHPNADEVYIPIGHPEIIGKRHSEIVKIEGYGKIGEYVPFYFTPRSIMFCNILTGYRAPLVPQRAREEIIVVQCEIKGLSKLPKWFFTDGQGNDKMTMHYNDLSYLREIDWKIIHESDFAKDEEDLDKMRRYQAEFLVYNEVPLELVDKLIVYNETVKGRVMNVLSQKSVKLDVRVNPYYFFNDIR